MKNTYLFIATLIAYLVKGITGFGNTLVMGPLYSFAVENRITTPIDLIFSIPTNIYMVWKERKSISLKAVVPLSVMLMAGILPGTFLLKFGYDWVLKSVLGIVVILMAVEMLTRKQAQVPKKPSPVFLVTCGILSGILAGMYGISALLIAYISRTTDNRSQFRGNICCVFLVDNFFRLFLYWFSGILNKDIFMLALILLPAVVLGMMIGVRIDKKVGERSVKNFTVALLIFSGLVLILKSILFH